MIELLMLLIIPQEIDPVRLGIKYTLKEKFIDYKSCDDYLRDTLYVKQDEGVGIYYKIDDKEYQVMLTYCKPVKEKDDN